MTVKPYPMAWSFGLAITPGLVMTPVSSLLEACNAHLNTEPLWRRWLRGITFRATREVQATCGEREEKDKKKQKKKKQPEIWQQKVKMVIFWFFAIYLELLFLSFSFFLFPFSFSFVAGPQVIFGIGLNQLTDYCEERTPHTWSKFARNFVGSCAAGMCSGYLSHVPHNLSTLKLMHPTR